MKWIPDGPCAFRSDNDRYMVARSPGTGFPATYTLVELGAARSTWNGERFWEGSTIVATMIADTANDRKRVMDQLMEKCR